MVHEMKVWEWFKVFFPTVQISIAQHCVFRGYSLGFMPKVNDARIDLFRRLGSCSITKGLNRHFLCTILLILRTIFKDLKIEYFRYLLLSYMNYYYNISVYLSRRPSPFSQSQKAFLIHDLNICFMNTFQEFKDGIIQLVVAFLSMVLFQLFFCLSLKWFPFCPISLKTN